jgi:hypothetical protein
MKTTAGMFDVRCTQKAQLYLSYLSLGDSLTTKGGGSVRWKAASRSLLALL